MSRCVKDDRRADTPKVVSRAESSAAAVGPATFNGRSNMRAPKNPANKQTEGKSGLARQATRLPN